MEDKTLTSDTIKSLSKKLDEFAEVLTGDEHAVLLGLIGAASSVMELGHAAAETEGITAERAVLTRPDTARLPRLSGAMADAFKTAFKPGLIDPSGPLADSVGVGWLCVSWSKDLKAMPGESLPDRFPSPDLLRVPGLRFHR